MNIIQANKHYYHRSGADNYIFGLTELLEEHGHNVIPFAMEHRLNLRTPWEKYFPSYVQTKQPKIGFNALRTLGRGIYSFEARDQMQALIRESRPDIAHIHNIYTQISPSILDTLRDYNIPRVMTVHDYHLIAPNYMLWSHNRIKDYGRKGLLRSTWSRFHKDSLAASFAQSLTYKIHRWRYSYQKGIDLFITPSEFVRQKMIDSGFASDKIKIIPHFIDSPIDSSARFSPLFPPLAGPRQRRGRGSKGGSAQNQPYVLFAGRLVPEKGVEVLIHAMEHLPDVQCKIVGDGPDLARLQEWARDLPQVEFLGWKTQDELRELYKNARALIVPSLWYEVFGMVAIEAMAMGTPVIASDIGGLPEVVEDGVTGRLFPAGDIGALQQLIREFMSDDQLYQKYSQAALDRVRKEYNPELHYDRIISAYRSVLQ